MRHIQLIIVSWLGHEASVNKRHIYISTLKWYRVLIQGKKRINSNILDVGYMGGGSTKSLKKKKREEEKKVLAIQNPPLPKGTAKV